MGAPYANDWVLAFDASYQLVLLDVDLKVLALEVSGDGEGEVEFADGLCPLVRESILLRLLFGAGGGLFGGRKF